MTRRSCRLLALLALTTIAARHPPLEPDHGPTLSGDEVRTLLVGKTEIEGPASAMSKGDKQNLTEFYLRDDGTGYMFRNGGRTIWRGHWTISGDKLCLPGAYWPCAEFHSDGGRVFKHYLTGDKWTAVDLVAGDPEGIGDRVDNSYPYNNAKPIQ